MQLADSSYLATVWQHVLSDANTITVMRHGPKSGGDNSDLSHEGVALIQEYAEILHPWWNTHFSKMAFIHTKKLRTTNTLQLLFPQSDPESYRFISELDAPTVSTAVQQSCDTLHAQIGRWRSYYLNHTYYFLEQLGGNYGAEHLHQKIVPRMVAALTDLLSTQSSFVYCGHSPALEAVVARLLNCSLTELGGFLNPLDSLHIRREPTGSVELVSRINPILGYVDAESMTYFPT